MIVESWPEYVRRIAGGLTQAQIAARVGGVSTSSVGSWVRGEPGQPDAGNVIAFAKAFNQPPLEALTAAGYFDHGETIPQSRTPLSRYSTEELLDEIRARMLRGEGR